MNIPFADLKRQYDIIKDEVQEAFDQVFTDFQFIGSLNNDHVKKFELNFANFVNVNYAVGCANGTDAIEIALNVLGIGSGHEVLVPATSWFSTSETVSMMGATPIFVDVKEGDLTIDASLIEKYINEKTKAIIPVHLYGGSADMTAIKKIADRHNLKIIEDCAQAHGAKWNNETVGSIGDMATFSFYPGKNLGAFGDAGAIVTNSKIYADHARLICQHGQVSKHNHKIEGRNSRLDGLHAATLNVKLGYIKQWSHRRREIASKYNNGISNDKLALLQTSKNAYHVYHLYVIKCKERLELIDYLKVKGIGTSIHYPTPLPFLDPYKNRSYQDAEFKVAQTSQNQILSIPMFPEMTDDEVMYVIEVLNAF